MYTNIVSNAYQTQPVI